MPWPAELDDPFATAAMPPAEQPAKVPWPAELGDPFGEPPPKPKPAAAKLPWPAELDDPLATAQLDPTAPDHPVMGKPPPPKAAWPAELAATPPPVGTPLGLADPTEPHGTPIGRDEPTQSYAAAKAVPPPVVAGTLLDAPPVRKPSRAPGPPPPKPAPTGNTPPEGTQIVQVPSYSERHGAGITIAATCAVSVLLSLLPLPDQMRPFQDLTKDPLGQLRASLWPKRGAEQPQAPAGAEGEPAEKAMVFDEMDLTGNGGPSSATFNEAEARRWEKLIEATQATHTDVENAAALAPFFDALKGLKDGSAKEPVRVITIGTSLIASDHITDVTRRLLQTRHGSGGLGFMFVDRPTRNAGRTVRNGSATPGWMIEKITDTKPLRIAGLGGVSFTAPANAAQETTYLASGTRRADVFVVTQPGGGVLKAFADGQPIAEIPTDGPADQPLFQSVKVPPNVTRLTFRTGNGPVRLDGVALENGNKGLVFDTFGLPGATAQVLMKEDQALFQAQLAQRKPQLIVLMIGGNDAFDLSLKRYTPEKAQAMMQDLITRVKDAAPQAACLLATPPDAGIWRMDKTISTRSETKLVAGYMRELAKKNNCASYDMQAAMGGEGSIRRWWDAGIMNRDLVHPLGTGGDVMGYMLDLALEKARQKSARGGRTPHRILRPVIRAVLAQTDGGAAPAPADAGTPFLSQPEALARFFTKLRALETTSTGRVGIVQMGASHTAAQYFTDEIRRQLSTRFGYAGRGFVAAGKASTRLEASGVSRALTGEWKITDALAEKTSGLTWGLTGVRAEGGPGSSVLVSFDEPHARGDDVSRVQVFYLDSTDGGTPPEVRIDGRVVPVPGLPPEAPVTPVRVLEMGVPGSRHLISVANPGPGPLSVFGVSHELMRPGIVYDALGLPGSTAITLASYAQQPLAQQLEARQVDLFVLFYGTNESSLSSKGVEEMKRSYPGVLATLRLSAPDAACLVLGPTDRMSMKGSRGKGWHELEANTEVQNAMRAVAAENNCAFWSTRDVMGGKGSIAQWRKEKLANKDHVHLTPEGYFKLAGLLVGDLLKAYEAWRETAPPPEAPDAGGEPP